jgi:aminopeptidase YwaD
MIDPHAILHELDFERLAGTDGEEKARKIITNHLERIGAPYELEEFELNTFTPGKAVIEIEGKSWDMLPFGLENDKTVEGELVFLENAAILEYNPGAYRGKIVMSYGAARRIHELLKENGVAAFIAISSPHKKATNLSHRQKRYEEGAVPAMTIEYDDAVSLIDNAGKTAKITIEQKVEKKKAENIVVSLGKPVRDESLTYLVGHYDSVARSHGSTDNAGGTVCLIKAAEYFTKNPPERELKIIFFSGEELGLRGSFAYTKAHEEEIKKRARLVVNVDVGGDVIGTNTYIFQGTQALQGFYGGISREAGLMFSERLDVYSSDGVPFAVYEIPSVNLARMNGKGTYFIHTEDDVAKHTSPRGLNDLTKAVELILTRTLNAEIFPVKKEIDSSLQEKLEKYLWNSTLEKPELKWLEKYKK